MGMRNAELKIQSKPAKVEGRRGRGYRRQYYSLSVNREMKRMNPWVMKSFCRKCLKRNKVMSMCRKRGLMHRLTDAESWMRKWVWICVIMECVGHMPRVKYGEREASLGWHGWHLRMRMPCSTPITVQPNAFISTSALTWLTITSLIEIPVSGSSLQCITYTVKPVNAPFKSRDVGIRFCLFLVCLPLVSLWPMGLILRTSVARTTSSSTKYSGVRWPYSVLSGLPEG